MGDLVSCPVNDYTLFRFKQVDQQIVQHHKHKREPKKCLYLAEPDFGNAEHGKSQNGDEGKKTGIKSCHTGKRQQQKRCQFCCAGQFMDGGIFWNVVEQVGHFSRTLLS